jgi:hypothetical protein
MNLTETVGGPLPLGAPASLVASPSPAAPSSLLSPAGARQRPTSLNQLTPPQPDRDAVALTAARATALAVAPPRTGMCG